MNEIEKDLKQDIQKHMVRLSCQMKLFNDMRGAYAFKRSEKLYNDLAKVMVELNREGEIK